MAAKRVATERVRRGTVAACLASSLLQPMVEVKSNSSLQTCTRAGALHTGQGQWLQSPLPWVVELSEQT